MGSPGSLCWQRSHQVHWHFKCQCEEVGGNPEIQQEARCHQPSWDPPILVSHSANIVHLASQALPFMSSIIENRFRCFSVDLEGLNCWMTALAVLLQNYVSHPDSVTYHGSHYHGIETSDFACLHLQEKWQASQVCWLQGKLDLPPISEFLGKACCCCTWLEWCTPETNFMPYHHARSWLAFCHASSPSHYLPPSALC